MADSIRIDYGGPAFPETYEAEEYFQGGMSLRDWFAGHALVGLLSSRESQLALYRDASKEGKDSADYASEAAYEMADAMLTARKAGA